VLHQSNLFDTTAVVLLAAAAAAAVLCRLPRTSLGFRWSLCSLQASSLARC
jgi:ABC-type uncharacterized transport system permease subunit